MRDRGAEAPAAAGGQHADPGDLRDAVGQLVASRGERPVRPGRGGEHRPAGPQPVAQHLDGPRVVARGDLVPLGDARPRRSPSPGARTRPPGTAQARTKFRVVGATRRDGDARRHGRSRGASAEHEQRVRVHPEARRRGRRGHLRRRLLDPLERLGDQQFPLPGPHRTHVGGRDRQPLSQSAAGRSTAIRARRERTARAGRSPRHGHAASARHRRRRLSARLPRHRSRQYSPYWREHGPPTALPVGHLQRPGADLHGGRLPGHRCEHVDLGGRQAEHGRRIVEGDSPRRPVPRARLPVARAAASTASRAACRACSACATGGGASGMHVDRDRLRREAEVPGDDLAGHDLDLVEAPRLRGQPLELRNRGWSTSGLPARTAR